MFSFFRRKKSSKEAAKQNNNALDCDESNFQSSRFMFETQEGQISAKFQKAQTISAFNNHGSKKDNDSNSSTKSNSPQMPNLQQTMSCPPIQQKVFIEYTVQKEETLDDICLKFNMDKKFLMELNQVYEEDKIPKFLVVEATPIQQQIIRNHALKEETVKIIEKNTNLLGDNKNTSQHQDTQDMEELKQKIAFFSNLEKNEDFHMKLITDNGIINGTLIVNSFMIHFSPEMKDFKRLQKEIEHFKSKKANKYHKFENNDLGDYSVTLDFNDIFLADVNVVEAIQTQNTSKSKKMQVKLDIFLTQALNWSGNSSNKSYLKVEFLSSETFEPKNEDDCENIGRTYVHYILQKVQYLIGKSRSHNEAINQFTDNFEMQPSQSIVKHFQVVSCDSLQLMNIDSDSLFSTEQVNPPRLQIYPSLIVGSTSSPTETITTGPLAYNKILNQQQFEQIVDRLPCYIQNNDWYLVYCPIKHGFSYEQMIKKTQNIGPHIIVIRDAKHKYIFGAFVTQGWAKNSSTYGSAESFLFSFKKNPDSYQRKYQNILCYRNRTGSTQIQYCSENGIAIGIDTKFALFIHYSLSKGTTHSTRLMQNDLLTESSDFKISDFEIWGLDQSKVNAQSMQS